MNNNIENLLTEVSRIKVLMNHQKGNESINEQAGLGKVITRLKSLATNSVDDIAKLGNDKLDELIIFMSKTDSADDYFESLYMINSIDKAVAKTLRRDTFIQLPLATQKRLKVIKNAIEERIGNIPENELDTIIDNLVRQDFPNESEEVITYLKQSIDDLSETISTKRSAGSVSKSIDDIIDEVKREGDSVAGKIDNASGLSNAERSELKRLWNTLWLKKESFYDQVRRKAGYGGEKSARLKNATNAEIEKIIATANDASKTVQDETAIAALEKAMSSNILTILPKWVKWGLISMLLTKGASYSAGMTVLELISGIALMGAEKLGVGKEDFGIKSGGGILKLNSDNEGKILKALNNLKSDVFNTSGTLKDDIIITYSKNGDKLVLVGNDGSIEGTYTLKQINDELMN